MEIIVESYQNIVEVETVQQVVSIESPNVVNVENLHVHQDLNHTHTTEQVTTDTDYNVLFDNEYLS